jgi:SAM-dependent methyltransferase
MTAGWEAVWERRAPGAAAASTLARLMALDGLDTGFGSVSEENWVAGVREAARRFGLSPGDSVFEVGCGAGGFLYDLHRQGFEVAGLDRSATLLGYARQAMPGRRFLVADAIDLDVAEPYDAVVSCGVFLYFPSEGYARQVIEAMARKARRVVAILDLPDDAKRAAAEARRAETVGGATAYAERYAGLEHRYYDQTWIAGALAGCGLADVQVAGQWIEGYPNSEFRFNAWGSQPA